MNCCIYFRIDHHFGENGNYTLEVLHDGYNCTLTVQENTVINSYIRKCKYRGGGGGGRFCLDPLPPIEILKIRNF